MRIQLIRGLVEECDYSHVESFLGSVRGLTEFEDHEFPVQGACIALTCVWKWRGLVTWFTWVGLLLGGAVEG